MRAAFIVIMNKQGQQTALEKPNNNKTHACTKELCDDEVVNSSQKGEELTSK